MLRALGFPEPRLLAGGYAAWLAAGGEPTRERTEPASVAIAPVPPAWPGTCVREDLADLQARGGALVDARDAPRYRGDVEPIDPVAGHIPGALNRPWQAFVGEDGAFREVAELRSLWGDLAEVRPLVVYCGSGVSACVNLLALAELGRDDALLYAGSWSDWCSYL
jgi:thiosulfate/3-mercaptopyruvate sulfurtransferase